MVSEINVQQKPLVTVVVPVYNAEKYLEECLNSIANQTYSNLEIIVIDDQSTDSSGVIADTFAGNDSRFTVIHKNNAGPGAARNDGIKLAKGKYLQFVDADDILENDAISNTVVLAEDTNADIVSFNFTAFNSNGSVDRSSVVSNPYPSILESSSYECLKQIYDGRLGYFSWSFLYNVSSVRSCNMKYPEDVHLFEDMYMLNMLFRHNLSMTYCSKSLYRYRLVYESLSHAKNAQYVMEGYSIIQQLMQLATKEDVYQSFAISMIPTLLYLDAMLPIGGKEHKIVRREIYKIQSRVGLRGLRRSDALKVMLTRIGLIDIIRMWKSKR